MKVVVRGVQGDVCSWESGVRLSGSIPLLENDAGPLGLDVGWFEAEMCLPAALFAACILGVGQRWWCLISWIDAC